MREAKHTPGPWWATDSGIRDRGGYICHTKPPCHYPGQDVRYEQERVERAANKDLIAAAPDLLEALKRCRFDSLNMTLADLDFCRAAIAKAEGRT